LPVGSLGPGAVAVIAAGEHWAEDGALRPAVEDLWGAGAFIAGLVAEGVLGLSPEALAAVAAYHQANADIRAALRDCASGRELIGGGYPEDVETAAELNASSVVPLLDGERFRPAVS
ncbi:2-phosphosulfolactate phosphatase, partial [Actinoplanes derwentensis]